MAKSKIPLADRFWNKVDKNGPVVRSELGQCWLWTGTKNRYGYGIIQSSGKYITVASRRSWEMTHQQIPEGLCVCHKCDNRLCVRPEHLFLGTNKDNTLDMVAKGRHKARGPVLPPIPSAHVPCECGCGGNAGFWTKTDKRLGRRYGEPKRFIYRHHLKLLNSRF